MDIENNCKGIYHQQEFKFSEFEKLVHQYTVAWAHSPLITDDEKYFFLYPALKGAALEEYSQDRDHYNEIRSLLESQRQAALTAKISLGDLCFYDLVPEHQLHKWFSAREECMRAALSSMRRPKDYDILHKAHVLASKISRQNINYDNKKSRVDYNIFGSVTGRLTTNKGSVPIMTMKKEDRQKLKPSLDAFVELDLNAAEIRTLLFLQGTPQPSKDLHEWIAETTFSGELTRDQVKTKVFAWLYNFSAPKSQLDKIFSRQIFRDFFASDDEVLTTPFGRRLVVEERKAQNYLLQSTTSDQVLENAYKIQRMLRGKKSTIAFTLHDSIILDMSQEDVIMLREIKKQFEQTRWGNFVSTCKVGKTFGDLKDLNI